jgi:hypothetical protein
MASRPEPHWLIHDVRLGEKSVLDREGSQGNRTGLYTMSVWGKSPFWIEGEPRRVVPKSWNLGGNFSAVEVLAGANRKRSGMVQR